MESYRQGRQGWHRCPYRDRELLPGKAQPVPSARYTGTAVSFTSSGEGALLSSFGREVCLGVVAPLSIQEQRAPAQQGTNTTGASSERYQNGWEENLRHGKGWGGVGMQRRWITTTGVVG